MQAIRCSGLPLAYQLEGSGLVTSLPYLDHITDKAIVKQAKKLVAQELEAGEESASKIDLQGLDTDVETPYLDHLAESDLGKRNPENGRQDRDPSKRGSYEASAINIEQLKERYFRVTQTDPPENNKEKYTRLGADAAEGERGSQSEVAGRPAAAQREVHEGERAEEIQPGMLDSPQEKLRESLQERDEAISGLCEKLLKLEHACEDMKLKCSKNKLLNIKNFE